MEVAVSIYQITLRRIPEDGDLNTRCREHITVLFITDGEERLKSRSSHLNAGINSKGG
jgi:hypothetical protein